MSPRQLLKRLGSLVAAGASSRTRWSFSNPAPADVVIVDGTTTDRLQRALLDGLRVTVLDTRFGTEDCRLYVSVRIVRSLLRYFASGCPWFASYTLACLDQIRPKVVLDNIHQPFLVDVARRLDSTLFFVILNAPTVDIVDRDSTTLALTYQEAVAAMGVTGLSNFHIFCFGEKDVDSFSDAGLGTARTGITYHPVGSMCADYVRSTRGGRVDQDEFDICFISQTASESVKEPDDFSRTLVQATATVVDHLDRYVRERGFRWIIQLRSPESEDAGEGAFFEGRLSSGPALSVLPNTDTFSVYSAVARSRVTVSLFSTLCFEAMAWGKRAVFCPLSFGQVYRFLPARCANDASLWKWRFEEVSYETIRDALDELLNMSDESYVAEIRDRAQYLVAFGSVEGAHVAIRRMIDRATAR